MSIDPKDLKGNSEKYLHALLRRGMKETHASVKGLLLDVVQGNTKNLDASRSKLKSRSKEFPNLSPEQQKLAKTELRQLSDDIKHFENIQKQSDSLLQKIVLQIPNIPKDDVPDGNDESANVIEPEVGEKPKLKEPKDYLALTEAKGFVDLKRAAKVSGSRFGYLVGPIAQLEFALVQYAQETLLKEGFTMVVPPAMIKEENMAAMGYLSGGGKDETYHFAKDNLYLVGTSEQSIGPMHRDEVFQEEDLPKRYLSFSTCFRREAGSYGKDTKGILRVHQFDKLEMFSFTLPEKSDAEHEFLLATEEQLWQGLDIPYRVVKLCAGDLGWPSARTYDLEAWMPGQGTYREVCSTSTTTDYQSRALNIKVQRQNGKEFVHMLNGTAFAIGRTLIAIIENYQQADGSMAIPKVLQPYMGGLKKIQ